MSDKQVILKVLAAAGLPAPNDLPETLPRPQSNGRRTVPNCDMAADDTAFGEPRGREDNAEGDLNPPSPAHAAEHAAAATMTIPGNSQHVSQHRSGDPSQPGASVTDKRVDPQHVGDYGNSSANTDGTFPAAAAAVTSDVVSQWGEPQTSSSSPSHEHGNQAAGVTASGNGPSQASGVGGERVLWSNGGGWFEPNI